MTMFHLYPSESCSGLTGLQYLFSCERDYSASVSCHPVSREITREISVLSI